MPKRAETGAQANAASYGSQVRNGAKSLIDEAGLNSLAAKALQRLEHLPEPGSEAWKYSPVNRLYEALTDLPTALSPSVLSDAEELLSMVDSERYPLAAMAALSLHTSSRVTAADGEQISLPSPGAGHHWQHIDVPANCSISVIQQRSSVSGAAHITTISLGEGAKVAHALTGCADSGTSWQLLSINQQANSDYNLHQLSLGGDLERLDTHIRLLGRAANATLTGALLCGNSDRCDNQTVLEHVAPLCTSTARYHGLANHTGKLTFGGRIHIHEGGAGTDARLHNPNLLLSDSAEINTKPELEIYNDDVACAHGATVGQLDDDAVFYLRSRGVNRANAYALLLRGFVSEALQSASSGAVSPDAERAQQLTAQRLSKWTL